MGVAELCRLRILEEETRKLRQLVADLSPDKQMLQDLLRKNPRNLLSFGPGRSTCRWLTASANAVPARY